MLFGLNRREAPKEEVSLPVVGPYGAGGEEPTLKEMLSDPMIQKVARSDKIAPEELSRGIEEMKKRLARKPRTAH